MSLTTQDTAIEEIRQDLDLFLKNPNTKRPMSVAAKGMGLSSSSILSAFLSDSYRGDNEGVAQKAKAYMERERAVAKAGRKELQIVETTVYKRLRDAAEYCYRGKMGLAYGASGIGKTRASDRLAATDPTIIRIEVVPGFSLVDLLISICEALRLRYTQTIMAMFQAITGKLTESGRLILIDEAEYLNIKALDILRRIHDIAGVGVLLIGTPKLNYQFRDKPDFRQIDNRIRIRVSLDNISVSDAKQIIAANAPECVAVAPILHKLCAGDARRLESLTDMVLDLSRANKAPIDEEICEEAVRRVDKGE